MKLSKPFTYLIGWSKHKLFYYGVRYAFNCSTEDLWTIYFTSSSVVKNLRKEIGEPDIIKIRKTFDSSLSARQWETKVLKRMKVRFRNDFINLSDCPSPPSTKGIKFSEEIKKKMSISHTGMKRSIDHCLAISKSRKGKQTGIFPSEETKLLMKKSAHSRDKQSRSKEIKLNISKAQIGFHWWTNGIENTRAIISPGEKWYNGRTTKS